MSSAIGTIVARGNSLLSNSSPTLNPTSGTIATDNGLQGSLVLGNGGTWLSVPTCTATTITGVTLSNGTQPSYTNCTIYCQATIVGTVVSGTPQFVTIKHIVVAINATITPTAAGTWSSPAFTIPTAYTANSGNTIVLPFSFGTNTSSTNTLSSFGISSSGILSVRLPSLVASPISELGGVYF